MGTKDIVKELGCSRPTAYHIREKLMRDDPSNVVMLNGAYYVKRKAVEQLEIRPGHFIGQVGNPNFRDPDYQKELRSRPRVPTRIR